MKITKTTRETWHSRSDEGLNNRKMTTKYSIDVEPHELPELEKNFIAAGLGDIKPIILELIKNMKK
jgi:hypothetical protein